MATIRVTGRFIASVALMLSAGVMATAPSHAQAPDEAKIILIQTKPKAQSVIESAASSENARLRLAALEATEYAPAVAWDLARNGLTDDNPAVRFGALVVIGKLELRGLADAAMDLTRDDNESVRAAALFAAKKCGKDVNLSPLAGMLANGSSGARANAAMLIGQLGDDQAIEMLRDMAAKPMPRVSSAERSWVRLQYAEAIVRLDPNDAETLGTIRASVYSNLDDVRVLAIQILGEVRDRAVQGGLRHIVKRDNPIQVKLAAAQALVRMGDREASEVLLAGTRFDEKQLRSELREYLQRNDVAGPEAAVIRDLMNDERGRIHAAAEVRAQAAIGLGDVKSKASAERLSALLSDPDPVVRVAAASAILRAAR
jgi:HEAT repeat protein